MERYLTKSEARQKFLSLVDEVADGDQVVITNRGMPQAVLVNFEYLETLKAMGRILQDPEALRAMGESLSDVKRGRVLKFRGTPELAKILAAARKKGLVGG